MEEILKKTLQDVSNTVRTQEESLKILKEFLNNLEHCRYYSWIYCVHKW
ncbi:hypothetical protein vBEcoMphAPEC6_01425 [Escherichia phage ph0011]|nr:hypothetical protein vBEcoMphAPEC6_01425 [Escherichia phage ph0011]